MFGKILKGLFSGSPNSQPPAKTEQVDYEGFSIIAEPRPSNGQWQVAGRIEKQAGDDLKVHTFIRADTLPGETDAANEMIRKAKMMIDQQGETLFD